MVMNVLWKKFAYQLSLKRHKENFKFIKFMQYLIHDF